MTPTRQEAGEALPVDCCWQNSRHCADQSEVSILSSHQSELTCADPTRKLMTVMRVATLATSCLQPPASPAPTSVISSSIGTIHTAHQALGHYHLLQTCQRCSTMLEMESAIFGKGVLLLAISHFNFSLSEHCQTLLLMCKSQSSLVSLDNLVFFSFTR